MKAQKGGGNIKFNDEGRYTPGYPEINNCVQQQQLEKGIIMCMHVNVL
jgi:hypothetical protein